MNQAPELATQLVGDLVLGHQSRAGKQMPPPEVRSVHVRELAPGLPRALFARPKSGFQLPLAQWLFSESPVPTPGQGGHSRALALGVLRELGVPLSGRFAA